LTRLEIPYDGADAPGKLQTSEGASQFFKISRRVSAVIGDFQVHHPISVARSASGGASAYSHAYSLSSCFGGTQCRFLGTFS